MGENIGVEAPGGIIDSSSSRLILDRAGEDEDVEEDGKMLVVPTPGSRDGGGGS